MADRPHTRYGWAGAMPALRCSTEVRCRRVHDDEPLAPVRAGMDDEPTSRAPAPRRARGRVLPSRARRGR